MPNSVSGYRVLGQRTTRELLELMRRDTRWMESAKCRGKPCMEKVVDKLKRHPELREKAALAVCAGCPVMRECAKDALLPIVYYVSQSDVMDESRGRNKRPSVAYTAGSIRAGVYVPETVRKGGWLEAMGRLMEIAGEENIPDVVKMTAA